MKCSKCKTENADSEVYCSVCGAELHNPEVAPVDVEVAVTAEPAIIEEIHPEVAAPVIELPSETVPTSSAQIRKKGKNGTDVNLIISGCVASLLTVISYVAGLNSVAIFSDRGWVPYAVTGLSWWCFTILAIKLYKLLIQKSASEGITSALEPIAVISQDNVSSIMSGIKEQVKKPLKNIYFNRVKMALGSYKSQGEPQEVAGVLRYQADIDINSMEASYTVIKVFIWAIPILGFIGTVIGIGEAVGSFSEFLQSLQNVEMDALNKQISSKLGGVTTGLATAFDTTMLALILSIPLMILSTALQKQEESFLTSIEEYCLNNLLRKFRPKGSLEAMLGTIMSGSLENQITKLNEHFEGWISGFRTILDKVAEQLKTMDGKIAATQPIVDNFANALTGSINRFAEITSLMAAPLTQLNENFSQVQPVLISVNSRLELISAERHDMKQYRERSSANLERINASLETISNSNGQYAPSINDIKKSLEALEKPLAKLNQPIVIRYGESD